MERDREGGEQGGKGCEDNLGAWSGTWEANLGLNPSGAARQH
jgi:hypothetical protein